MKVSRSLLVSVLLSGCLLTPFTALTITKEERRALAMELIDAIKSIDSYKAVEVLNKPGAVVLLDHYRLLKAVQEAAEKSLSDQIRQAYNEDEWEKASTLEMQRIDNQNKLKAILNTLKSWDSKDLEDRQRKEATARRQKNLGSESEILAY
ncbi:MAG TPA: hypothetical protein VJJ81_04485 [Candidatus Babeliales bacterium]|nr:hypothetical protein [Candidatus Babeliales bacterium]